MFDNLKIFHFFASLKSKTTFLNEDDVDFRKNPDKIFGGFRI
ncbi:hypothetical protein NC99_10310 [Sunxiuqinia dokdonensis]|uniref:Uncharacterized protein n=1 Tax=Sunxiuqinia dokdonensis TaxID=1409788 RepID=A0A0L8VCV9_9BACT|nr:hypothetical protein NC99_10310 [Sunxiuqinia dokdonensis]